MELSSSFVVDAPVEQTWQVLTDLQRVAPCVPGATLTGVDGEDHHGRLEIAVGPVAARYEGTARLAERDDAAHAVVFRVEARPSRGEGVGSAWVMARLTEHGDGTHIVLRTDLALTGRGARVGRAVIADVGGKIMARFGECLDREIPQGAATANTTAPPAEATTPRPADPPRDEGGVAVLVRAGQALRRAAPTVGAAVVALGTGVLLGRRGRHRTGGALR